MTVLQGRYQLLEVLGEGAMGKVYKAQGLHLNRLFAVKELLGPDPDSPDYAAHLRAFRQEGELLASLSHPRLPRVVDFFEEGGRHYLVMDYIEGRDLRAVLESGQRFSLAQAVGWGRQLLEALGYLHGHQPPVVVRDLKPANLMVTPQGELMLVDFGIARILEPGLRTQTLLAGMGTPGYAPPEQYAPGHSDPRSDLYAVGATLYHLVSGQVPPESVQLATGLASLPALEDSRLDRVLRRAMAPRMEDRYQTASEFLAELEGPAPELAGLVPERAGPVPERAGLVPELPGYRRPDMPAAVKAARLRDDLERRFAELGWKRRQEEGWELVLEGPLLSLAPLILVSFHSERLHEEALEQLAPGLLERAQSLAGMRRSLFVVLVCPSIVNPMAVEQRALELSAQGLWRHIHLLPADLSQRRLLCPSHLSKDNDLHDPVLTLGAALGRV